MACEKYKMLMMGHMDEELEPSDEAELARHLEDCPECLQEFERFKMLKEVTDSMQIKTLEDKFWDGYWGGIYNRLERGIGWLFAVIGTLFLCIGGSWIFCENVMFNSSQPFWMRCGSVAFVIGLVVLILSVSRERYRAYQNERYKDIRR